MPTEKVLKDSREAVNLSEIGLSYAWKITIENVIMWKKIIAEKSKIIEAIWTKTDCWISHRNETVNKPISYQLYAIYLKLVIDCATPMVI